MHDVMADSHHLGVTLTIALSGATQSEASTLTETLKKLIKSTGSLDFDTEYDPDDPAELTTIADKYFFGHGVPQNHTLAFERYLVRSSSHYRLFLRQQQSEATHQLKIV